MRYGPATIRQVRRYGTRVVIGERFVITAEQPSLPVHCTVRTLTATGYITAAVSTEELKPAIMETIPVMNTQVTVRRLNMSSTRRRSTPSIAIVQAVLPQSGLKVMNLIPSLLQR